MQIDTKPSAHISPFLSAHLIGQCAKELAEHIRFPLETANFAALMAASHAVGSVYTVCYPEGDALPVPLYGIAEQPSGTGKSWLVGNLYRGYIEQGAKLNKEIVIKRDSLKKEITAEQKQGNNVHHNKLAELESMLEVPRGTTDATPQSLEKVMDRYQGFFMVYGTEQNLTKTLLGGLYSDGQTVDGIINSAFNGEYSSSERASSDRVTFQGRPFGGVFCLSQEGTIQTVLNSAGTSGLAERFLMIREDDLLGNRSQYENVSDDDLTAILTLRKKAPKQMTERAKKVKPMPAFAQYRSKMGRLAIERANLQGYELAELKKLRFKPEAWAMIEAAKELFERRIGKQAVRNAFIASMNSKIDMLVMKCAATIHVMDTAEYQDVGEIGCDSVFAAFSTVHALFEGVNDISSGNKLYGDDAEDEFVLDHLQNSRRPLSMDQICQAIIRKKNENPFRFYQKRGEGREKIRESVMRLVNSGKCCERKGENPVYSA